MGEALREDVEAAVAAVRRGGLVVFPTDTVYGLGSRPDPQAVERIFALKERAPERVLQLLVPSVEWVERVAVPDDRARKLIAAFFPGPLTLVLPASGEAPEAVAGGGAVGIRIPAHPVALELLAAAGPLAATSANRSGEPTPSDVASIRALFGSSVDAYVDGGTIEGRASTVVDLTGAEPMVLREGSIASDELARVLGGPVGGRAR